MPGELKVLSAGSRDRLARLYCALAGLVTSVVFTFLVYPVIAVRSGAVLDPDLYGALGWGLRKFHTFSYFPSSRPSVSRGPLYPLAVAASLKISGDWWPHSVQIVQCLWFAITCVLTFEIGRRLWNRRVGGIAAAVTAVHPFILWYTSRIWVETMAVLLFTWIVFAVVLFHEKRSAARAAFLGLAIGAACLCKGTFLPFIAVVPAFFVLWVKPAAPWRAVLPIPLAACLVIAPWTARNWRLTGTLIPVHGQFGFNDRAGDYFIEHIGESPLSVDPLWRFSTSEAAEILHVRPGVDFGGWRAEQTVNAVMGHESLVMYWHRPQFLLRKIALNALLFWTWSETRAKTVALGLLQIPLFLAFAAALVSIVRRKQARGVLSVPAGIVLLFYASHLPVLAAARYSVVLVPTMLIYSTGMLFGSRESEQTQSPVPVAVVALNQKGAE